MAGGSIVSREEPKMTLGVLDRSSSSLRTHRGTAINSYVCLALCKSRGLKEGNKAKHRAVIRAVLCE